MRLVPLRPQEVGDGLEIDLEGGAEVVGGDDRYRGSRRSEGRRGDIVQDQELAVADIRGRPGAQRRHVPYLGPGDAAVPADPPAAVDRAGRGGS